MAMEGLGKDGLNSINRRHVALDRVVSLSRLGGGGAGHIGVWVWFQG